MTTKSSGRGDSGRGSGMLQSPALGHLKEAAAAYAAAQSVRLAKRAGDGLTGMTGKLENVSANGGSLGLAQVAKGVVSGDSPARSVVKTAASQLKEKVKSVVSKGGKRGGRARAVNIVEGIDVGVPVSVAYDQWTQFADFPRFMKGIESVDQKDETTTAWRAKIAKARRTWEGKIVEQIPDQRVVWTSNGPKGTSKGVVTFHSLAPELTRVLVDLEYFPSGLVEKTANMWRPVGRRVRLELKNYRRFITMEGQATGSWRGTIEDGDVVSEGEEADGGGKPDRERDQQSKRERAGRRREPERDEESEPDEEPERAPARGRRDEPEDEPEPDEEPERERAGSPDYDEGEPEGNGERRSRRSATARARTSS